MKTSLLFVSTIALAAMITISGCSSSSTDAPVQSNHTLKIGDTFTYHEHQTDGNDQPIDGTDTTVTATVAATGITIAGRTDATIIISPRDTSAIAGASDSVVYVLQDSITIMNGVQIPQTWVPCVFHAGSKTIYTDSIDAVVSGTDAKIAITIDYQYDKTDSSTIGSEKFQTQVFEKKVLVDFYIPVIDQHFTELVTAIYHYAPKIGFFTARSVTFKGNSDQSPFPDGSTYDDLVSYSWK